MKAKGDFHWVPAAVQYRQMGGAGIFIKYAKNPNKIVVKERGEGYTIIQCPDRDLIITTNQHKLNAYRPMQGTYDEYVHLGAFHDELVEDINPDFFMVNYTADMGREHCSAHTRNTKEFKTQIISDSGGFQLFQQRIEYLDPVEVVKWYNTNCDIGLILDIPTSIRDDSLNERTAKIQAANTAKMMDNKVEGLELMNIVHGVTREQRDVFRGHVERDDIDRLALGGFYTGTILNSIDNFCAELEAPFKYKHYHVLGVANPLQVLLFIRMAHKGFAPLITCDSSTFLRKAITKEYHCFPTTHSTPKFIVCGDTGGYIPSSYSLLPCSCPVCAAIKYSDIMLSLSGNMSIVMMSYHNMYSMTSYYNTMKDLMYLSTKDLKAVLKNQFGIGNNTRSGYMELIRGLDFIDQIEELGLEKARKNFQYYLTMLMPAPQSTVRSTGQIFSMDGELDDDLLQGEDSIEAHQDYASVDTILTRYETEQAKDMHGKKNKILTSRVGTNAAVGKKGPGVKIVKREPVAKSNPKRDGTEKPPSSSTKNGEGVRRKV